MRWHTAERWRQIDGIFAAALEQPPGARDAFIRQSSAGDEELYQELHTLLQSADVVDDDPALGSDPARFVDQLLQELSRTIGPEKPELPSGGRIGVYRLLSEAGRGGMAAVYLAERDVGGTAQRVALKLIKRGTDTDEVLRRFSRETRVLASLDHPNIAHFFDAGVSPDHRPFLVMEFVEGRPLTVHCDEGRLGLEARLRLFTTVCRAVQYAHQRLIVHRDLKPSNILVTTTGEPKLLDFGIAKLLSPDELEDSTRTGVRAFTPEYSAPEQVRGESISTAADVYALGMVLYELLAGCRPSRVSPHVPGAPGAGADVPRVVPPSEAVRRLSRDGRGDAADAAAAARHLSTDRLRRALEGDLDRIVMKALDPEPERRYQAAQQLIEDLERRARGLPVLARPATLQYRVSKYVRRHRNGLAVLTAALLLLASFAGFHTQRITGERDRSQQEAERARAATRFLQRLLSDAYPSVARGDTFSMDELLRRAVVRIDSLTDQPGVQAELLRTIGDVYREQGQFAEGRGLLERAVAIHRNSDEPRSVALGSTLSALGHLHFENHDYEAAMLAHEEELAVFSLHRRPDDSLVLYAMNNLAAAATGLERYEQALELHEAVIARHRRLFDDTSQLIVVTRNNLGNTYDRLGRHADAEREFRATLALRRALLPKDHPSIALALNNLGNVLRKMERVEEAEPMHREALAMWLRVFGPDHHRVGLGAYNLGKDLELMGRYAEAESLFAMTVAIDRKAYGDWHSEIAVDLQALGKLQVLKGDCPAAMASFEEAERIHEHNRTPVGNARRTQVRTQLAGCMVVLGRHADAERVLLGSYSALGGAATTADSTALRDVARGLAELYDAWGRTSDAERFRAPVVEVSR